MSGRLRTFCHISEYDEAGYRQLHRLIAASDPLVLWAPSSQFLIDSSSVAVDDFLNLVYDGKVQVVAREEWLTSRSFRNDHPWPGAHWNFRIDDALREMMREDDRESDLRKRKVAVAPEESGHDRARRTLEEEPEIAREVIEALDDRTRVEEIPPGTLATARRRASDNLGRAEVVLRDAHNHADAIALTKAETAILLGPGNGVFSQRVAAIFTDEMQVDESGGGIFSPSASATVTAAQLSRQLVDLLARIEGSSQPVDLRSFMEGEGHRELIEWSRGVIDLLAEVQPAQLKEEMLRKLKADLTAGNFVSSPTDDQAIATASLALALVDLLQGSDALVLFGLAFAIHPLLRSAAERRGLIDGQFTGPQWPFRYLWGSGARRGLETRILSLLEDPAPGAGSLSAEAG